MQLEEKAGEGEDRCADGWTDGWMNRLSRVCKRFAMATLAEPVICQRPSECIREGSMDGKWVAVLAGSLLLSTAEPQHMMKCACCDTRAPLLPQARASASSDEQLAQREASLTPRGQLYETL